MIFGVKYSFLDKKKSRKSYWILILLRKTIGLLDHIRYVQNNMGLQNKETYNEQLFCYTEVQRYHYSFLS